MEVTELVNKLVADFPAMINLQASSVVAVSRSEDGWVVSIEMIEKKSIPDSMDILGCYEVSLDGDGEIRDFSRLKLRRRGDTAGE
jgi:hypothetical protein